MREFFWFILGAAVSIPAGIVAALSTPAVQRKIDSRSKIGKKRRVDGLKRELKEAGELHGDPRQFTNFLVGKALKIVLIASTSVLAIGLIDAAGYAVQAIPTLTGSEYRYRADTFFGISRVVMVAGSLLIASLCVTTFRVFNRVRDFPSYKSEVQQQILSLGGPSASPEEE